MARIQDFNSWRVGNPNSMFALFLKSRKKNQNADTIDNAIAIVECIRWIADHPLNRRTRDVGWAKRTALFDVLIKDENLFGKDFGRNLRLSEMTFRNWLNDLEEYGVIQKRKGRCAYRFRRDSLRQPSNIKLSPKEQKEYDEAVEASRQVRRDLELKAAVILMKTGGPYENPQLEIDRCIDEHWSGLDVMIIPSGSSELEEDGEWMDDLIQGIKVRGRKQGKPAVEINQVIDQILRGNIPEVSKEAFHESVEVTEKDLRRHPYQRLFVDKTEYVEKKQDRTLTKARSGPADLDSDLD